jgi:transposase
MRNYEATDGEKKVRLRREDLSRLIAAGSTEQRIARRARIVVLRVFRGLSVSETARRCGTTRPTVRKWTGRFQQAPYLESLQDLSRTGGPARITARDETVVISLGCQRPEGVGRLEARMTQEMIVEEASKQDVHLSRSSVQRILAQAELQPHRQRYFLFTPKDHPEYRWRRDALCDLYTRELPPDEVVICYDEKTGIQVLGTPHPGKLSAPGRPELIEHNYVRYGSRNMVVAMRIDTGELVEWELFPARGYRSAEVVQMLRRIAAALPDARIVHLVWDNASTHCSKATKDFLASPEGQKFRVYYTPTHASWLNQAETVFSKFSRRFLGKRRYASLENFDATIYACLEIYNATVAKASRWRYNPAREAA